MKYWLRILRAFFGFESIPKCEECRKYCVKGWVPDDDAHPPTRWYCLDCYPKEST